jgi:hypothetical protein
VRIAVWLLVVRIVTADNQVQWVAPTVEFSSALECFALPLELGANVIQANRLCVNKEALDKQR